MKNTLFGSWTNDSDSMISNHYFLLLIPAVILISMIVFRKAFASTNDVTKSRLSLVFGSLMILSSISFFTDIEFSTGIKTDLSFIFKNLNNYLLLILGISMLLKKYAFVKAFIPTAIVMGLAPIVSNPENALTSSQAINDIALATMPIFAILLTNKSLSLKGLIISLTTNLILLSFIFGSKNLEVESTNLSISNLSTNTFYGFFKFGFIQVFIFISAVLFLETLIWVIIRFAFTSNKDISFIEELKLEASVDRRQLEVLKKDLMYMDLSMIELTLLESPEEINSFEGLKAANLIKTLEYPFRKLIDTFTIIRTRNAQGTRAPSL